MTHIEGQNDVYRRLDGYRGLKVAKIFIEFYTNSLFLGVTLKFYLPFLYFWHKIKTMNTTDTGQKF
jgi:hypothetical protein